MAYDPRDIPWNSIKLCNKCKHQNRGTVTCKAFPDRIPREILSGRVDHSEPFPGDHGIQFEPREK